MLNATPKQKKTRSPSQEVFENIRNFQPSKSETFTYVTFSETPKPDGKAMRSRTSSSSSTTTTPGSRKTSRTCQVRYVTSKIGSLDNITHTPGGGKVKITGKKIDVSHVQSKCGSLQNQNHTPTGGNVKIVSKKPDFSNVKSKVGSRTNHTPGGGKVKIVSQKKDYSKVQSKCGSLENAKHRPGGGNVEIFEEPIIYKTLKKKPTANSPGMKKTNTTSERGQTPQIANFHGT